MRNRGCAALTWLVITLGTSSGATGGQPERPAIDGNKRLAVVNGEPITLDEFLRQLDRLHSEVDVQAPTAKQDPAALLERLVDVELIVQEAQAIGLDETPKIRQAFDVYRRQTLRSVLLATQARKLPGPDPKEVERLYQDAVRQYGVTSILVEDATLAAEFAQALAGGDDFDATVAAWVAAGKATGGEAPRYIASGELSAEVVSALSRMAVGEVSPPIPLGRRVAFVKLHGVRYAEDPQARERALADATTQNTARLLKQYLEDLRDRHSAVDEGVLASLDFEAPNPGFDALLADPRVVAKVGGEPVTVGMLAEELRQRFFHGVGGVAGKGKVNAKVAETLDQMLIERAALEEARRLKLDTTDEYEARVDEYVAGVLFGAFVEKVVEPDVRPSDEVLRAYFERHSGEYSGPETMRLDSLVFAKREDAERVLDGLRKGADFQWMRANAAGQTSSSAPGAGWDAGTAVPTADLPDGVREAVAGAGAGEARLYADPDGTYRILFVRQIVPGRPLGFEAARDQVAAAVFRERRREAVDDWTAKLRAASEIEVLVTGDELLALLRRTLQAAPE
jgi:parvulin-like peptidyl-prolyl isomerase